MRKFNNLKMMLLAMVMMVGSVAWGQYSIVLPNTEYKQDFNTLTSGSWIDGTTLDGWYAKTDATATIASYAANTGTSTNAGLYAFGVTGTNPLSDRALGYAVSNAYFGSAGTGKGYLGWRLKNNTGSTITSISVKWTGEQWRKENNSSIQNLNMSYQIGATVNNLTNGVWISTSSSFSSPIVGATTATALDGNSSANRTVDITLNLDVIIAPNEEVMLRWEDLNDSGNDHLLAIDDVKVKVTTGNASPALTAAPTATVDAPFDVTFTDIDTWSTVITDITVGGVALPTSAFTISSGKINFDPSKSTLLQTSGTKSIAVKATGYADATVSQVISVGAPAKLGIKTQPAAPAVNGGLLATQPVITILDKYGNTTTSTADVTATIGSGTWILGGTITKAGVNGTVTFTDLTAKSIAAAPGATITFSSNGLTDITSNGFDIPAPIPALNVTPISLSGFSYKLGEGPSAEQSFKVSGLNLSSDVTITSTTNYELSTTSGASFVATSPITLPKNDEGTVAESTIYVRLKAGLSGGNYNENISVISDTESKTVNLSGIVKVPSVVISQAYGGGGNSGALYKNDFIELYNPTSNDIDLAGWSVQYASATGTSYSVTNLTKTIKAGHYYLIQQAAGTGGTQDLPTPDDIGIIQMGGSNFKVALANNTISITGLSDENVIDFVGVGTANQYEGTAAAPAASNTESVIRNNNTDTDDNKADFLAGTPSPRNSQYYLAKVTDAFRSKQDGNWADNTTWEASYDNGASWYPIANTVVPTSEAASVSIGSGHLVTVATDATASELTIQSGGKLTVNDGLVLGASSVKLLSDDTHGAATILGNVSGTAEVNQYVTANKTFAISSPVVSGTYSGAAYTYNAEAKPSGYSTLLASPVSLTPGLGYAVRPTGTNIQISGTLNNENVAVPLNYNGDQTDIFRGWNLIGNPYPSVLNWKMVYENNSSAVNSSIWYGFNANAAYNASGDISVPVGVSGQIQPMQGFWVISSADATSTDPSTNYITLNKDYRMHNTSAGNLLKAPKVAENQIIRLVATSGTDTDEMVLYFNANASNAYDKFDTRKMMATSPLKLYTLLDGVPMLINGMNTIPYDTEIALAFQAAAQGTYTIKSTEFSNFAQGEKVILKDKQEKIDTDLTLSDYVFNADLGTNLTRFSLVLPKSGVITSVDKNTVNDMQLVLVDGKLQILLPSYETGARVNVYNNVGQLIVYQLLQGTASIMDKSLSSGVYIVKVESGKNVQTQKFIVKK